MKTHVMPNFSLVKKLVSLETQKKTFLISLKNYFNIQKILTLTFLTMRLLQFIFKCFEF